MKIKTKFKLTGLFFLVLLLVCSFALKAKAEDIKLNLTYPTFGNININYPGGNQDLNQIIAWLYYFIIGISGFSAFFMFVWGGFQWSSSAGNPNVVAEAKDKLTSAALGVLIVLSAYLILQVVNPELTTLNLPQIQIE